MEPADPRHCTVRSHGQAVFSPRVGRLLGRSAVFAPARPADPPPPCGQRSGRGAEEQTEPHDHDGAGSDAAQHSGGHGGGRHVRRISRGEHTDHGGKCAHFVARHRHSELSRRGDHLHAAPGGRRA